MVKIRVLALYAALVAVAVSALAAGQANAADAKAAADKERELIAVLQSNVPAQDKAVPCKQLAIYGSKAAVPALAALLPDKDLSSWARIALEAIPDPACDDALRDAMGKLQGRLLIGVINSIGVRRDAKATAGLAAKLKDADAGVASAAAAALGRIGGNAAVKALEPMLAGAPPAVRTTVAEGVVLCAERFMAEGKNAEAVRLYDAVRKSDVPKQRILEGTRGAILARQAAGVPLLVEQLKSTDKDMFGIGLRTARELPGPEATEAVAAEMSKAASDRQALMLMALADRGDVKALPAVLAVVKTGATHVRIAAMGALERFGNASCVPAILEAAADNDADVAQAARTTLARMPGKEVDAELVARLPQATGKARQAIIEVAGQRRIEAAMPAIAKSVGDADAAVRATAVEAIGAMGGEKQVADLVVILKKTADAKDQADIEKALMGISGRAGAACTPHLMPLVQDASPAVRAIGLHVLAIAGGPEALAALKAAIGDKDETVQDEAARTLSTWPNRWAEDAAAADVLLGLAKSAKKVPHQVLALRGYLQYVQRTKNLKDDERLTKVKEIMPLLTRPEEKRLAISVLGSMGSAGALEMLETFAADPATAEEACTAIVAMATKKDLKGVSKEQLQKALQTVIEKTKTDPTKRKAEQTLKGLK